MSISRYRTAFVACLMAISSDALAQQTSPNISDNSNMRWNIPTRTLGGKQFWTDELIEGEWRIQRHVFSGHYRLLDPTNTRRGWGSWDACLEQWQQFKLEKRPAPLKKRVVLVLHGLGRSRASMNSMVNHLADSDEFSVLNFSYASTRSTLADHANSLAKVIDHLEGVLFIDQLTATDRIWRVEEGQEEQAEVPGSTAELLPADLPVEFPQS